jgi:lipopolysaccharide/colanic/teichoic acid biosynthesis glycosyltransferase
VIPHPRTEAHDALQRAFDVIFAVVGLLVAAPVLLVLALAVRRSLGSPVFFRQARPGRHGEIFCLVKFRTMVRPDPACGLVSDEERLTPFGRWLRSTSLDELPSLVNVLRGDMSVVGPRPLLVSYLGRYDEVQARRHEVRPGLTGLAQVSGRNALGWQERLALDVRYVDTRSIGLDLRILLRTARTVLRREGISGENSATMTEFLGNRPPAR